MFFSSSYRRPELILKINTAALLVRENFFINEDSIESEDESETRVVSDAILQYFPVMRVTRGSHTDNNGQK